MKLKTKLTKDEFKKLKGSREAHQYKWDGKFYVRNIRRISGVYKAWLKAPKFLLQLDADLEKRHFITKLGTLTTKRSEALKFAVGFDDPHFKQEKFQSETGLKLKVFYEHEPKE